MATLLIVEDDIKTNEAICEYLKSAGHKLIPVYDGASALQSFDECKIDLMVLDIMLPKISGLSVLHEIRQKSSVPKLMLTAIEDEYTQVTSFDEQADDYITKPFSMVLLGRRITALLRRSRKGILPNTIAFGDVIVNFSGYSAKDQNGKARTLASDAPVILADEPTGNLDENTAAEIAEVLKNCAHQMNKCVIIVTHSNDLAKQADTVFRLKKGKLQQV